MNYRFIVLGALLCALCATNAHSWNRTGHLLTGLIAYDQSTDEVRDRVIARLERHPFFTGHFEDRLPNSLLNASDADKERWYFAQAATWPDIARGTIHHHQTWHFINKPIFVPNNPFALHSSVNTSMAWAPTGGFQLASLNGVQA